MIWEAPIWIVHEGDERLRGCHCSCGTAIKWWIGLWLLLPVGFLDIKNIDNILNM
jgi:hypothetical protein